MEKTNKNIFKIDEFEKQFDYEIYLSQMRFYYLKKGEILAITLIFQKKNNYTQNDPSTFIFTNPKKLGIEKFDDMDVKEAILYFEKNEEVINEFITIYHENVLKGLIINTSSGKFLEIGKKENNDSSVTATFLYPYFFNELNIEYNNKRITKITAKPIMNFSKKKENKIIELKDISEDNQFKNFIYPIFKSSIIGKYDDNLEFVDDIQKFSLIQEMKDNTVNITEISIWSDGNQITRFDTKYINTLTGKDNNSLHISDQFNSNNKNTKLEINNMDFIIEIKIGLNNDEIKNLCFKTFSGKKIEINNGESKEFIQFESKDKKLFKLLGLIIGKGSSIETIQFYYKLINI